nr:HAD-IIB family hydrolase [Methylomarinum sp. Ch1-1]MDP4521569.1 HAD-IIB family hydrolase [Methylomarinum sp. Ch1-1]
MNSYLIFTDLDGTLLDHQDYRFTEALAALEKIRQARIPLIINSSKTRAEIADIRKQLHNNGAFVVENGAAVCVPAGLFPGYDQTVNQVILGRALTEILPIIRRLRETHGFSFQGFNDFSVADVMRETGLNEIQAEQAKQRLASEPLKWRDSQERLGQFQSLLRQQGLQLIKGGRFWHVMGGMTNPERWHGC